MSLKGSQMNADVSNIHAQFMVFLINFCTSAFRENSIVLFAGTCLLNHSIRIYTFFLRKTKGTKLGRTCNHCGHSYHLKCYRDWFSDETECAYFDCNCLCLQN